MRRRRHRLARNPQSGNAIIFSVLTGLVFFCLIVFVVVPQQQGKSIFNASKVCHFCVQGRQGKYLFVASEDKIDNLAYLKNEAYKTCRSIQPHCVVAIWQNINMVPGALPLTPAQASAEVARFQVDWATNHAIICPVQNGRLISDRCL